jgi:hypothetical protein
MESLFVDVDRLSLDSDITRPGTVTMFLALSYQMMGVPREAMRLVQHVASLVSEKGGSTLSSFLRVASLFSPAFCLSGRLREAENLLLPVLKLTREEGQLIEEMKTLSSLLLVHAALGSMKIAEILTRRCTRLAEQQSIASPFITRKLTRDFKITNN